MKKFLVLVLCVGVLSACSKQATLDPNALTYKESQSIVSTQRGVVISVEQATVHIGGRDDAGVAGAVLGGLAGSQVSSGSGRDVAIVVGALGANYLGKKLTEKNELAFVYTIEKKDGGIITVSQTGSMINIGSPVLVREFNTGRKTVSFDQSQGKTFVRTKETSYEGDAEAQAIKKAAILRAQKAAAQKNTKRSAREEAEYQLELESKNLQLESQRLDVEKKSKRVNREDDFINKELAD
jgi:outer membrane lipoprotein SlyB